MGARIWSRASTLALDRPPPWLLPSHLPEAFIRVCSPGSSDNLFIWAFVERTAREFHFLFQEGEASTLLAEPEVRVWTALDRGGWLWDLLLGLGVGGWRAVPGHPMDTQKTDLGVHGWSLTGATGGPTFMTLFKCRPSTEPSTLASPVCPLPGDSHGCVSHSVSLCPAHVRLPPGLVETDSGEVGALYWAPGLLSAVTKQDR